MGHSHRPCADQTRDNILKVSTKLFSAKGFAATSISEIAKAAGINQSLIYHHFTSKECLWKRVKGELLENYLSCSKIDFEKLMMTEDLSEFIEQITRMRFTFYDSNPDIRRMIKWQELAPKQEELQGSANGDYQLLSDKLENFYRQGMLAKGVRFEMAFAILLSTPKVYFSQQQRIEKDLDKETIAREKVIYLEMVVAGLKRMLMA